MLALPTIMPDMSEDEAPGSRFQRNEPHDPVRGIMFPESFFSDYPGDSSSDGCLNTRIEDFPGAPVKHRAFRSRGIASGEAI